jgi:ribosomal protein S17E
MLYSSLGFLHTKIVFGHIELHRSLTLTLSLNTNRQDGPRSNKGQPSAIQPVVASGNLRRYTNCGRLQTVKKSAKVIIERYYPKLTLDFETNKRICDEIAIIASKRLRNKVSPLILFAGFSPQPLPRLDL